MSKKQTFEKALERLEEIARALETGDIPLEESLKYFEEGMELIEYCNSKLDEAQKKILKLTRTREGDLKTEPFEEPPGE